MCLTVVAFDPTPGGHWRFIEHAPDGDYGFEGRFGEVDRPHRLTQTFENQDRIAFTWSGQPNGGLGEFAFGDSCVAWVEFKQMDPAQIDRSRVSFRIGP